MASWGATVQWAGSGVGCFDPDAIVQALQESLRPDIEVDATDLLAGHYERTVRSAAELGIRSDSPAVLSAARVERQVGPRYGFRLRVGPGAFVSGQVDRFGIGVLCARDAEFLEPMRGRFLAFLNSLRLGEIRVGE